MNDKYKDLSPEDKISVGIMFMLTGATLPESIEAFFKENALYKINT